MIQNHPGANLDLIEGVIGKREGEVEFYQLENDDDQSGNMFSNRNGQYGSAALTKVKVVDYTSLFKKIDFVKCNIEGGEYQLLEDGFFDMVDSFVMEVHNVHVPGKNYKNVIETLQDKFDMEIWGNLNYKYCFINGNKKSR